jgi:hypothetical protein
LFRAHEGVDRAIDALNGMRKPIVEHSEPVKLGLDDIIKAASRRGVRQVAAERAAFAKDQRLTTDGAALIVSK